MFLPNKTIKHKKFNYHPKKMSVKKTTQYGEDVVMFLLNKIIKTKKLYYPQKKTLVVHMVLKPCTRPPKQPMVLKPCARAKKFFADNSIFKFLLFC